MKKILTLLTVVLLGFSVNEAAAQTATLTVQLATLRSVVVSSPAVNWTFSSATQFSDGEAKDVDDHLTVVSTEDYVVKVQSTPLTGGTGDPIPVGAIEIEASPGSASQAGATFTPLTSLTGSAAALIDGAGSTPEAKFDVKYRAVGGVDFLNRTGTFTGTVTYTITAP